MIIIYNGEECEIYNMSGLKKFEGAFRDSAIILIPKTKSKLQQNAEIQEQKKFFMLLISINIYHLQLYIKEE